MLQQMKSWATDYSFSIRILVVALIIGALAPIVIGWTTVQAGDGLSEWRGVVKTVPEGKIGNWDIGDKTFVADGNTVFDEQEGELAANACAKVDYETVNGVHMAREIDSEPAGDCDGTGNDDKNDNLQTWRGQVTTMPADKIGDWVVAGKTFTADANTEFDELEGELKVGACAKVKYETVGNTLMAREIDSEPTGDCDGNNDEDNDIKHIGKLDGMPQGGREGVWTVGGVHFQATTNTEFEAEHGVFQLGACVKVESEAATPTIAKKIETEHQYRCMGDGTEPPKAEMYGMIIQFPADLIGKWMIGGKEFMADGNTEFEQENGPFENGATIRVKFYTDENDGHHALKIETKFANGDDEDDDDDHHRYGQEGHAFGLIEVLPTGQSPIGQWTISGIVYEVNSSTEIEDDYGLFKVGTRVRVEFHTGAAGLLIADEIKITEYDGDVKDDNHTKMVGVVDEMPVTGFNGKWIIAGAEFMVNGDSVLKEEHGLFAVGSWVEVEYSIIGDQRMVHEMETHVPPTAGDDTSLGDITSIDDSVQAVAIRATGGNQWIIGGKTYTVIAATQLDDSSGALAVGDTAIVNSYIASDGSAVATSIRGITLDNEIYLPLSVR